MSNKRDAGRKHVRHAINPGDLQSLLYGQFGKDGGHGARQQCLSRPGRAHHDDVMPSRGRHLKGPFHMLLSSNVGHVGPVGGSLVLIEVKVRLVGLDGLHPLQVGNEGGQALHWDNLHPRNESRLWSVLRWHIDGLQIPLLGQVDHGKNSPHVADAPVQREFAHEQGGGDISRELLRGHQYPHSYGEIVGRSLLSQVGGGEVHRQTLVRIEEARIPNGRANSLARLLDRCVWQAHDSKRGKPSPCVHLYLDNGSLEAYHGAACNLGQHFPRPPLY